MGCVGSEETQKKQDNPIHKKDRGTEVKAAAPKDKTT